jgi:hypothetical protein
MVATGACKGILSMQRMVGAGIERCAKGLTNTSLYKVAKRGKKEDEEVPDQQHETLLTSKTRPSLTFPMAISRRSKDGIHEYR